MTSQPNLVTTQEPTKKPTILELHTSDRMVFKTCRQQWDFSSNLRMNLEPIPSALNALWFGTGIHQSIATYYTPSQPKRDIGMAKVAWAEFCAQAEFPVDADTYDLGMGMLDYYGKWAPRHDNFRVVHVETVQRAPLFRITRPYGGYAAGTVVEYSYRLDGLLEVVHYHFYIHELKTAASFDNTYDYLMGDDQCGTYIEREQARLGIQIEGVLYTVMRKATPHTLKVLKDGSMSVDKGQLTTYELAYEQIVGVYGDYASVPPKYREFLDWLADKPDVFIHREPIRRTQGEVRRTAQAMRWEIADMLGDPKIYRNSKAVNCNRCSFLLPCFAKWEGRDITPILSTGYRKRD